MNALSRNKTIADILLAQGWLLILLSISGMVLDPVVPPERPGKPGRDYYGVRDDFSDPDIDRLKTLLERGAPDFDLETVNQTVFAALRHSDQRSLQPHENWLLWLLGTAHPPLAKTQIPERIVAGKLGLCSDAVLVLNSIAQRSGVSARVVGLNGHVVAEVKTERGWQIADPDYGMVFPADLDTLESGDGPAIIAAALGAKGFDNHMINLYSGYYQSTEDNTAMAVWEVPSQRLYWAEITAEWLKWIIPACLIILGWMMRVKSPTAISTARPLEKY